MLRANRSRAPRPLSFVAAGAAGLAVGGCASVPESATVPAAERADGAGIEVVPVSEVHWGALNPARGDSGPRAADLWGDRTGAGATGFLVRFAEGFSSPPHIHNTTYRGVVIEGLIHNDDPGAAELWMPAGSYWTQPAGEVHITSAHGSGRLAYIEIQHGPYLVQPAEEASDTGERALNLHASNMVWLDAPGAAGIDLSSRAASADGVRVSYLWGDPRDEQPSAVLVALPAGFQGTLVANGPSLRIVVVEGQPRLHRADEPDGVTLEPGSYVGSQHASEQRLTLAADEDCVLYVRTEGPLTVARHQLR